MPTPILATKLYIPRLRPNVVSRPRLLKRLKLAQGDVAGAVALLAQAGQSARQHNFVYRIPEGAAVQVLTLLRQGNLVAAAYLAQTHSLPLSQARVHLAQGDPSAALAVLSPWREQVEAKGWEDERLKVMVLQAQGKKDMAAHLFLDALTLAEPGGSIRPLSTKVCRWRTSCPQQRLPGGCRTLSGSC